MGQSRENKPKTLTAAPSPVPSAYVYLFLNNCQMNLFFVVTFFSVKHSANDHVTWNFSMRKHSVVINFLDASSHLYKRVCPSIRPSVGPPVRPSVRPSVRNAFVKIAENGVMQDEGASRAVYPALFI